MSQGAVLWERVLKRHQKLGQELGAFSEASEAPQAPDDDPLAGFGTDYPAAGSADERGNAAGTAESGAFQASDDDPLAGFETEYDGEAGSADDDRNVIGISAEAADLWLSQSRPDLEHALLSLGLSRDVFPTKRPLLIFGHASPDAQGAQYHSVQVNLEEGWPCAVSAKSLRPDAAAKILVAPVEQNFQTVAVKVPNPLLPHNRWIVLWPQLEALPQSAQEAAELGLPQKHQVRRVVWCANRAQIGRREVIRWLSDFWQDTPVRVGLFKAASFVRGESKDEGARSKVLPKVGRALERFEENSNRPWVVVGP